MAVQVDFITLSDDTHKCAVDAADDLFGFGMCHVNQLKRSTTSSSQ